jgi:hypothetical protein
MFFEDSLNEAGGLELVQLLDPYSEHITAGFFDLALVELVLVHELEDEIPLLLRAGPSVSIGVAVTRSAACVACGGRRPAILFVGDKSGALDFLVNALLERLVKAGAFPRNVVDAGDLGLDADRELVARIPRKTEAFRVIGNEFECHGVVSFLVESGRKKARPLRAGLLRQMGCFVSGGSRFRTAVICNADGNGLTGLLANAVQGCFHKPVIEDRHGNPHLLGRKIKPLDQIPPQWW